MLIGRCYQAGDKLGHAPENNPTQNGRLALFGMPPVPLDLHPAGSQVLSDGMACFRSVTTAGCSHQAIVTGGKHSSDLP